ncbi:uncharacterized protein LOC123227370 [Mangifera indica]|uniref:uncharacterized protein LOC123227370 n=1 Tax=Mangifera indica TaxID=29780 RepID=UPI001CFBA9D7|nr:uncharacterized protein LOC123227370 [Mangifera indica]
MEHCENEKGEQSKRIIEEAGRLSPSARATLEKVKQRFIGKPLKPGTRCVMLDNSFRGYGWLLPGWIAEERRMQSGRIYRYYYDPEGRIYKTRHEVTHAWEQNGFVVIHE